MSNKAQAPRSISSMAALRERAEQQDDQLLPVSTGEHAKLTFISFSDIRPFKNHPFRLYTGERLEDMVESIRQNGILTPPLVRHIAGDSGYEMLAGHNRVNAGRLAGLEGTLCIVKEDLPDADALMYVVETNLMQRSFADLLPSEKAAVLTLRYSEMFSQGKRNDILQELRELEDIATCGTECHKLKSRDQIGVDYELKGRQVAKYLRIHALIDPLKLRIDNGEFSLVIASKLSYLSEETQRQVNQLLTQSRCKTSAQKIDALRAADQTGALTVSEIFQLLTDTEKTALPAVRVKPHIYQKFFAPNTPAQEMEKIIETALTLYFQQSGKESA